MSQQKQQPPNWFSQIIQRNRKLTAFQYTLILLTSLFSLGVTAQDVEMDTGATAIQFGSYITGDTAILEVTLDNPGTTSGTLTLVIAPTGPTFTNWNYTSGGTGCSPTGVTPVAPNSSDFDCGPITGGTTGVTYIFTSDVFPAPPGPFDTYNIVVDLVTGCSTNPSASCDTFLDFDVNAVVASPTPAPDPSTISVSSQRTVDENGSNIEFTFTRNGGLEELLSFNFDTIGMTPAPGEAGIATVDVDYSATSAHVSWDPFLGGTRTVTVPILDDTIFEGDETFEIELTGLNASASYEFDPLLTVTIIEDDSELAGEFNFSSTSFEANEDSGSITVGVERSGGGNDDVSVEYVSTPGTAMPGDDYEAASGTLSWAAGEQGVKTFTLNINTDILAEPTEQFTLELQNPSGTSVIGSDKQASVSILDASEPGAPAIVKEDVSATDFDGDGEAEVALDASSAITSDGTIVDVSWALDGEVIATGLTTSAKFPVGEHVVRVTATDDSGKMAAVDFIVTVLKVDEETTRMLSETTGLNTEQGSVAGALDSLCPRLSEAGQFGTLTQGQANLRERCDQLRNPDLSNDEIILAIDQIAGEEAEAIILTASRFTNIHQGNLRNRFTQLRRGGNTIIDVSGLNLRFDGGTLNGHMFADAGKQMLGGAASADEEPAIIADSRLGIFVNGNVSYGERDPSKNNSGFELDIQGVTAGADYRFTDNFVAGAAIGYSSSDLDYDSNGGELEGRSNFYSVYASYYNDANYYIDSSLTFSDSDFDILRRVRYKDSSGLIELDKQGSTGGEQLLATIDFGLDFNSGPWTFGPNGGLSYSDTEVDGFAEQGNSGLELEYGEQGNKTGTLGLGFHGSRVFLMDWGVLVANLNGNFYREFKNDTNDILARFVHDPFSQGSNATPNMVIISDSPDKNYFNLGIGLAAQFRHGLSGFIDYQTLLGANNIRSNELAFGLRYETKF